MHERDGRDWRAWTGVGDEPGDVSGTGYRCSRGRVRRPSEHLQYGWAFFWASTSDHIGRKHTYYVFFLLGIVLYSLVPYFGGAGNLPMFLICFLVIISMYGGGFATVPAYLRDMFGTRYVGAIHGWLITAWSVAGVLGPVLVNYIRQYQIESGVPKAQAYNVTMYIMAGLLVVGLIANFLIKAVDDRHHMNPKTPDDVIGVG